MLDIQMGGVHMRIVQWRRFTENWNGAIRMANMIMSMIVVIVTVVMIVRPVATAMNM